jgi:hypothetical protein
MSSKITGISSVTTRQMLTDLVKMQDQRAPRQSANMPPRRERGSGRSILLANA